METPNKAIEAFKITGDWAPQSKKLKSKFDQLTESDLKLESGKEEEMLARMGTRLNKKREEVIGLIKNVQIDKA